MADINWLPRESGEKNHALWGDEHFSSEPPGILYQKKPIKDPQGKPVDDLYSAWITLNNPAQYNSYTTGMVKGLSPVSKRLSGPLRGGGHLHRRGGQGVLHRWQYKGICRILFRKTQRIRPLYGSVQRHGGRYSQLQKTHYLPRQRHAGGRRAGDRHGL